MNLYRSLGTMASCIATLAVSGRSLDGHGKPFLAPRAQLTFLMPYANVSGLNYHNGFSRGVCWSQTIGFNYHINTKTFYSLDAGLVAGPLQFGENFGARQEKREAKLLLYGSVRRHHTIGRFDIGYGVLAGARWVRHFYRVAPFSTTNTDYTVYYNRAIATGLSFAAAYRLSRTFYAHASYQPTLLEFSENIELQYGHSVCAGFLWRIRLKALSQAGNLPLIN